MAVCCNWETNVSTSVRFVISCEIGVRNADNGICFIKQSTQSAESSLVLLSNALNDFSQKDASLKSLLPLYLSSSCVKMMGLLCFVSDSSRYLYKKNKKKYIMLIVVSFSFVPPLKHTVFHVHPLSTRIPTEDSKTNRFPHTSPRIHRYQRNPVANCLQVLDRRRINANDVC